MVTKSKMERLLESGRTVFTVDDLRVFWQEDSPDHLKSQAAYYAEKGKLKRLRRGVYALDGYNELELANKLIVPSYISLETALLKHGIIFQPAPAITSVAGYDKKITAAGREFRFSCLPAEILSNPAGLAREGEVLIASPERAVSDWLFLGRQPDFANLKMIDQKKLVKLAAIYPGEKVKNQVDSLFNE